MDCVHFFCFSEPKIALHVLGLQHKQAIRRHHHMVNLGGIAISQAQGDVVHAVVMLRVQIPRQPLLHLALAPPALEPGRTQHPGQQRHANGQRHPHPQHSLHLLQHCRHACSLCWLDSIAGMKKGPQGLLHNTRAEKSIQCPAPASDVCLMSKQKIIRFRKHSGFLQWHSLIFPAERSA